MAVLAEPNSSSEIVLEAQKLLNKSARQSRAPENGAFDKSTSAAIKQFQIESGLKPNGVLDSKLMDILRKAATLPPPKYQITIGSKVYLFTQSEYDKLIDRVKGDFKEPMRQMKMAAEDARFYWKFHSDLRDDQYIVGWCIEAWGRAKFPSESVIKSAEQGVAAAEKALNAGNFIALKAIWPKAEKQVDAARVAMKVYMGKLHSGGDELVTGLQFVSTASFITVGIIAAPVAASFGAGALASGVIAGAGTAAVETLSHEVGKGISGQSKGIGDAAANVALDTIIGAGVGAIVKGKGGDKVIGWLGPKVAAKLGGEVFRKANQKVVTKFVMEYFKKNGANILEGIMKETLSAYKSTAGSLTVDKFIGIVAKEIVTAGIFGKFEKLATPAGSKAFDMLSSSTKKEIIKTMAAADAKEKIKSGGEKAARDLFAKIFDEEMKHGGGAIYDKLLNKATGTESDKQLEQMIVDEAMANKKIIAAVKAEAAKKAKK